MGGTEITEPGIYEISAEAYHADPAPEPSLSSSGARQIIAECPARYWWDRNHERPPTRALDFGNAAHEWILEGDSWSQRHIVLPEDHDGRRKEGQTLLREIEEAGKRPLRHEDFETIKAMREVLEAHEFANMAFRNGKPEQSLFWRDERFGIWCRARPDWLPAGGTIFPDYKTARSVVRPDLERDLWNYGYYQRVAWYLDGVRALGLCEEPSYLFVFQEKQPPYLVVCATPRPTALQWGRLLNDRASHIFAQCLESGDWPGYADDILEIDLPYFAHVQLQERHERGDFEAAYRAQAPLSAAE